MSVSFGDPLAGVLQQERELLNRHWFLFLLLGILSVLVGMAAISSTFIAAMATVLIFGWLLVIQAIVQTAHGLIVRHWRGFALHLVAAVLYFFAGLFMIQNPVWAIEVLTLLIAAMFFAGGIIRVLFSLAVRFPLWGWVLFNGIVDLVLGLMIFNGWPESGLWVIGLFVGIDLLLHGWSCIMLALAVKTLPPSRVG